MKMKFFQSGVFKNYIKIPQIKGNLRVIKSNFECHTVSYLHLYRKHFVNIREITNNVVMVTYSFFYNIYYTEHHSILYFEYFAFKLKIILFEDQRDDRRISIICSWTTFFIKYFYRKYIII